MTVQIIAEIGSNFTPGDIDSAKEMIEVAAECGADMVKFQAFNMKYIDRPDWWKQKCSPWQIPHDWHHQLQRKAASKGLGYFFSVFDIWTLRFTVSAVGRPLVKVAASEIQNQALLRAINGKKQIDFWRNDWEPVRVYLSVDFRKRGCVLPALTWLPDCEVTLLHTVSQYPCEFVHTAGFHSLKWFGRPVGWSSHAPYPKAVEAALYFAENGATVIEAHLRTKRTGSLCPDNGPWALLPQEFAELVDVVRGTKSAPEET